MSKRQFILVYSRLYSLNFWKVLGFSEWPKTLEPAILYVNPVIQNIFHSVSQ